MGPGPTEDSRPIELTIPGSSRHIRLARLMAGGVATNHGLSVAIIEDVRIAVDEVCATLIEAGGGQPLHLTFTVQAGALSIRGSTTDADASATDQRRFDISRRILDVLTDTPQLVQADGQVIFTVSIPLQTAM